MSEPTGRSGDAEPESAAIRTGWVINLREALDAEVAGVKASTLGGLLRAGFVVSDGFVVSTAAFAAAASARTMTPSLREAVGEALRRFPEDALAVRSSGVAEDLPDAAHAGLYETVLDVRGDAQVIAAVERCWASASSARVAANRAELGTRIPSRISGRGGDTGAMAVLVQQMVPASASGVAFTADPVTGFRDVVRVSAIKGPGERLVSMAADADEWEVRADRATPLRSPEQALSDEHVREVARLARRVEAHFGGVPQDIEWAYSRAGRLHLLQARPITALPEKLAFIAPAPGGWARDFRFGEWLGEPLTPLFADWGLPGLEQSFWRELTVRTSLPAPRPTHVVVNGWYFGSVSFWPESIAGTLLTLFARRRMFRVFFQSVPALVEWATRPWIEAWREEWLPDLERTVATVAARMDETENPVSVHESIALIDELLRATGRYFNAIALVAGVGYKSEVPLAQFFARRVRRTSGGSHQELLVGLGALEAVRAHAVTSLDWVHPILDPPAVAQARLVAEQRREGLDRRRGAAEARALWSVKGRRRRRLARLIETSQRFARMREEVVASLTLGYPTLRRALLGIGRTLVERGLLRDEADVMFLGRGDLDRALGGATAAADLARVVLENRRLWQRRRRLSAPLQLGTIPRILTIYKRKMSQALREPAALASALGTGTGVVRGIPASPGTATGPARIVRAPEEFARLFQGDVLIAPATAPAWTVLFARAAAVVTDTGSPMAHASLVAREYGIPAVVGTGDATYRFRDGEMVTVDGYTGVVSRRWRIDAPRGDCQALSAESTGLQKTEERIWKRSFAPIRRWRGLLERRSV